MRCWAALYRVGWIVVVYGGAGAPSCGSWRCGGQSRIAPDRAVPMRCMFAVLSCVSGGVGALMCGIWFAGSQRDTFHILESLEHDYSSLTKHVMPLFKHIQKAINQCEYCVSSWTPKSNSTTQFGIRSLSSFTEVTHGWFQFIENLIETHAMSRFN